MTRCYSKKEVISRYLQTRRPHVRATSIKFRMARKEMKYLMGGGNLYLVMKNFTSNSKMHKKIDQWDTIAISPSSTVHMDVDKPQDERHPVFCMKPDAHLANSADSDNSEQIETPTLPFLENPFASEGEVYTRAHDTSIYGSLSNLSAEAWANHVLAPSSRILEGIQNKPHVSAPAALFSGVLPMQPSQRAFQTEAFAPSGSALATQCQSIDESDPFVMHQAQWTTEFVLSTPTGDSSDAEFGAQYEGDSLDAILNVDDLNFSDVHHIVSTTPSRVGGTVACIDYSAISPADSDIAVPPTPLFATVDSIDDFLIEADDNEVNELCAFFGSLGFNGSTGKWNTNPMFDKLCESFRGLEGSLSPGEMSPDTFSHMHLASTPAAAHHMVGHGAYPSYIDDEMDWQYDSSEDSLHCALPTRDSVPDIVMMEPATSFDSLFDDLYDGDSESSHDEFRILDASTGSLSDIAGDDDGDDFDRAFEGLESSPSFGQYSPIRAPRLHQLLAPMFLSLLSDGIPDIRQDDAFGGPTQVAQSPLHASPVPLASYVGLRPPSRFPGPSIWSPFAPIHASSSPFSPSRYSDVD